MFPQAFCGAKRNHARREMPGSDDGNVPEHVDFLHERIHDLVLGHLADDLAMAEDHAHPTTAGNAHVGVARLAGPFTTQPITATEMGLEQPLSLSPTSSARPMRSTCVRPHVGQLTSSGPRRRSPSACRMPQHTGGSSTGSAVSETRMVSPMPSESKNTEAHGALNGALLDSAGLGNAQMQRKTGNLARERTIRVERGEHAVRLGGEHDIREASLLEVLDELKRGGDELLRLR